MLERYITKAAVYGPVAGLTPEARKAIRTGLPVLATRRFTDASRAILAAMEGTEIGPEDDLVFGSAYGGSIGLEHYLGSFPNPSPASFQSSVHAGVLEVVLVARKQPLRRLQSIANPPHSLVPATLRAALLGDARVTHVVLAEERGEWLRERGLAEARTFACHLALSRDPAGACGTLGHVMDDAAGVRQSRDAGGFCELVERRESMDFGDPAFGRFVLKWL